jgi:transcriptional regulator GlxA family with amidase domain
MDWRATIKTVGFLGFEGVNGTDLMGPLEALGAARQPGANQPAQPRYRLIVLGLTTRSFRSESGVSFRAKALLEDAPALDTIVIPGGAGLWKAGTSEQIAQWLAGRATGLRRIVSISTGIFPVAQTAGLDGRSATTHWRFASAFANQFPKVRLSTTATFLKDGPYYTCGGGTAPVELALSLIEEDYGAPVALPVARDLVMPLRPPGENESRVDFQYQCGPLDRLADLPAYILAHLQSNLSVEALAQRAAMSLTHFKRLFKSVFKTTPADFVEQLRLDEARRQLLIPRNTVGIVAAGVGFRSADVFRRAFERRFEINPSRFRGQGQFQLEYATVDRPSPHNAHARH